MQLRIKLHKVSYAIYFAQFKISKALCMNIEKLIVKLDFKFVSFSVTRSDDYMYICNKGLPKSSHFRFNLERLIKL